MNRFNFRAWDSYTKAMITNPEDIPLFFEEDNGFHSGYEANNDDWVELALMQSTGLMDKNGVEIYEGDVVEAFHSQYETINVGEVKFMVGTFTIGRYWSDGIHDWISMEQYDSSDLEVIGNVFQSDTDCRKAS